MTQIALPQNTVADTMRFYRHPEVVALRAEAKRINALPLSGKERAAAMKAPLNAIAFKVAELVERERCVPA